MASFEEGVTSSSVTAFIVDDALPEGNETFTVVIDDARNGAEVGLRNTMTLIIQASDAPFGAVQFQAVSSQHCVSSLIKKNSIYVPRFVNGGMVVCGYFQSYHFNSQNNLPLFNM